MKETKKFNSSKFNWNKTTSILFKSFEFIKTHNKNFLKLMIENRHWKLDDSTNTDQPPKAFNPIPFSLRFLFLFRNRRFWRTQKNKRENLNNVLRRFANTTRKLLRKKIKAKLPPTKENEVEWLVWALNAFVVVFFSLARVCIMQLFIWSFLVVLHRSSDHFLGGKIQANLYFYRLPQRLFGA